MSDSCRSGSSASRDAPDSRPSRATWTAPSDVDSPFPQRALPPSTPPGRDSDPTDFNLSVLADIGDFVAGDLVCVDATGRVAYANDSAARALSQSQSAVELVGRSLAELLPAALEEPLHHALARALSDGQPAQLRLPHDGSAHPFEGRLCRLSPVARMVTVLFSLPQRGIPSISSVVRELNQSLEFDRIVGLVARHAVELLGGHHGSLFTLDGDDLVVAGVHGDCSLVVGQRLPVALSFSGEAIRAARPVRICGTASDDQRWPTLARDMVETGANSASAFRDTVISAPLLIGGRPIGAVTVSGRITRDFNERDETVLAELADHAAIAVENARLYSAAARAARHTGIIADTAAALTSSVTTSAVYEGAARIARTVLGTSGACVLLADPSSGQLTESHGDIAQPQKEEMIRRFWQLDTGIVLRSGVPCFVADMLAPANADAASRLPLNESLAYAVIPLEAGGQSRGVLVLCYRSRQKFDFGERHLLIDFAAQIAMAMRNAALVSDLERRAARLIAVARVQQAIARTDIEEVYAELQRAVASVVDAPAFAVLAADSEAASFDPQYVMVDGRRLAAESIPNSSARDAVAAEACRRDIPLRERPPIWSWSSTSRPEPGREWHRAEAGIVAPIRHGSRVLGVLHVQSYRADAYSLDDADLVAIIARQAGAALELARLFGAEQRERELAEASAEIARLALGASTVRAVADQLLAVVERVVPSLGKALAVIRPGDQLEYVGTLGVGRPYQDAIRPTRESLARFLRPPEITELVDLSVAVLPGPELVQPRIAGQLVPLVARERVIGMLVSGTPTGTILTGESREALLRLAAPVALALDMLLLNEEERRRMEREQMLAAALATMDQPVLVLDPEGQVRYANEAAVREYGYPQNELTGLPVERLIGVGTLAPTAATATSSNDVGRSTTRSGSIPAVPAEPLVHYRRDGSTFPVSVTRAAIRDDEGQLVGEVLGMRNLSEERRVAEQLRQHEKLAALGSLVAGVAHELNNPLTGISAFAQLLLEEPLNEEQNESVRLIKREADRAGSVIRDLLLFSRKTDAHLEQVDINSLVQLTLRLRTYTLRTESIAVDFDLAPDAPLVVADEQRLQQVLLNLLVNAEYAMHGSEERRLTLRTRAEGEQVIVEIADTGAGMDAETQRHIFEPFFTTKPPGVGTGLGLSVSYGIVQAHGGGITVASHPGGGTTFRITLPSPPHRNGPDVTS